MLLGRKFVYMVLLQEFGTAMCGGPPTLLGSATPLYAIASRWGKERRRNHWKVQIGCAICVYNSTDLSAYFCASCILPGSLNSALRWHQKHLRRHRREVSLRRAAPLRRSACFLPCHPSLSHMGLIPWLWHSQHSRLVSCHWWR